MKNTNKILLLLFWVLTSGNIYSQITEEYKQELINSLSITDEDSSNTVHYGCNAINWITEYEIKEAVPAIVENIWKQDASCRIDYLWALEILGYEKTEQIALAMLDSLNGYGDEELIKYEKAMPSEMFKKLRSVFGTELSYKLRVVKVLFEIGNYKKYQIVFDRIDKIKPALEYGAIFMLREIIFHYPEHEKRAKDELIKFAYESNDDIYKRYAVTCLDTLYGEAMIDVYLDVFSTANGYSTRGGILSHTLTKYNSPKVHKVLKQRLSEDPFGYNRYKIAKHLLEHYGTISDYRFVKNYIPNENDDEYRGYIASSIKRFSPVKVKRDSVTTLTMLDTLTSYTTQSYNYDWIRDEAYKDELLNKITLAKNYLLSNDSLACRREIELFQNSVEQVFTDSAGSYPKYVSDDGYKFLYYQAEYILERLPETTAPPTTFDPIAFVDTLLSYNTQCLNNGWLSATWVHTVLKSSLDNAKLMLQQNLLESGKQIMIGFNVILNNYKTNNFVTTEGYNLLKPKSDYLISKLDSLMNAPQNVEALALLDAVLVAHETCNTEGWYSSTWVYTNFTTVLNNAKTTLEQNNPLGCKAIMDSFIITLDSYKTSGFITEEGYNYIKPKCLALITELSN